jgi:hypothetical protein
MESPKIPEETRGASCAAQFEIQEQQDLEPDVAGGPDFNFECHYSEARKSVRDFLEVILPTFSTYSHIHNWDGKLAISPLERLVTTARQYERSDSHSMNVILNHSTVEEVLTIDERNYPQPAMQGEESIESFMLFTKASASSKSIPHPTLTLLYRTCPAKSSASQGLQSRQLPKESSSVDPLLASLKVVLCR